MGPGLRDSHVRFSPADDLVSKEASIQTPETALACVIQQLSLSNQCGRLLMTIIIDHQFSSTRLDIMLMQHKHLGATNSATLLGASHSSQRKRNREELSRSAGEQPDFAPADSNTMRRSKDKSQERYWRNLG